MSGQPRPRWERLAQLRATLMQPVCACRHGRNAHQHYRPGSDCSLCDCPKFRAQP